MEMWQRFPGIVLAIVLCGVGVAQHYAAWQGWTLVLGWQWAVVTAALSLFARFNGYALAGTFFYAHDFLHWPPVQCAALAAVGLLFLTPRVFREVMAMLLGTEVKPL
ncbi:MAG: hypothetical protein WCO11_04860 [Sphingomonadales bacterium]